MKRIRILLALACIGIWLVASGLGGPTFAKISEVSSNDRSTFLPASSESTKAAKKAEEFTDSSQVPAIVVASGDQQFADKDVADLALVAERLKEIEGVDDVVGPIPSRDGKAVEYITLINAKNVNTVDVANEIRTVIADDSDSVFGAENFKSLVFHLTGPAGFAADLSEAFSGIDGILLLVTLSVVFVILILVYRSILLPILVLLTAMAGLCGAIIAIYYLAKWDVIALNGMSQGIASILVIGATTDYSLLLVARHKEELHTNKSVFDAMKKAVRGSFSAITASASTVVLALLCLLASDLESNSSLGPIVAIGITFAWAAALTMLPALLYLFGRAAYWPSKVRYQGEVATSGEDEHGVWSKISTWVGNRPRAVWLCTFVLLAVGAAWLPTLKADGLANSEWVIGNTDSKMGQRLLNEHFDAGSGSPTTIVVSQSKADEVLHVVKEIDGVASVTLTSPSGAPAGVPPMNEPAKVVNGDVLMQATLEVEADSTEAEDIVTQIRDRVRSIDDSALVGGTTATAIDTNDSAMRDLQVIIPLVLVVVLVILMILLRAVLLPILLVVATVVSFGTAMGVSALVFNHVFKFDGADPSVPLYGFVFLVALGIDYTIFLMARARQNTPSMGTRKAVLHSLAVTGGVITSAGIVLAATFAALAVVPLVMMAQTAFIVAFGVLVDTLIVRTLLIPGLVLDIGPNVWWPFRKKAEAISASHQVADGVRG